MPRRVCALSVRVIFGRTSDVDASACVNSLSRDCYHAARGSACDGLGWVVAGIVVVGVIASLSDDDAATDASNNSQSDVNVDNEAAVTDAADARGPAAGGGP